MKDFAPLSCSSFPLAIPVQLDSSHETLNTRRLSPINGAASAMKNFLRRRRGVTLVITNNADTDKVNHSKSNRNSYELPTPQPSMAFVIVGGHGVVPGTTTVIFESGHSQSTAAVTTPVSTSATPAIHVSTPTMPSQTPANTHLSSLPAHTNGLLAVTAAVSAHRKLLYRASRCVSIDGLLLLNSEPIIDEEPRAMTIAEIVNSHAYGMNQTYINNSIPSDAHFASNSADDSKSADNSNLETSHLPEDTLQHQLKTVDISALDLKEEYYEDEDEDEDPQDQLYENSLNLIADYLTRYTKYNNLTPHQSTTNVQDLQVSLEEIENEIKVLKSQEITLQQHPSADDVVLVSDLSSPTQYYDAPQTRQALRSYVGGTEKEFDEMVEYGFPTDAFSHRQQRGQATQCRYSTLRVTLTPWHARADELDLYGQISEISGKHAQFKSMVHKFFSRAPSHSVSTSPSGPPPPPSSSTSSSQRRERSYVATRTCSDSSLISSTTSNTVESASANHFATQARCRPHSIGRDPKAIYRAPIQMIAPAERDNSNFEMLMSRPSLPIHYASSYLSQPPRKRTPPLTFSAAVQVRYEEDYDFRRVPVAFNSPSESDLSSSDPDHHLDSDDAIESTSSLADSYYNGSYRSTKMENIHPATSAHIGVHYHRSKGVIPSDSTLIGNPLKPLDSSQGRSYRDRESDEMAQMPRRGLRYPLPQAHRQYYQQQQQHQYQHQQQQAPSSYNSFQGYHHGSLPSSSRMPSSALPGSMHASLRAPASTVSPVSPLRRSMTMVDPKERFSLDETRRDIPSRQSSKMFGFSLRDKKKRDSKGDGSFTLPRIGSMGWRGRDSSMGAIQISGPLLDVSIDEYREEQLQKKRLEQEQEKEAKLLRYRQQQEDIVRAMKACSFS